MYVCWSDSRISFHPFKRWPTPHKRNSGIYFFPCNFLLSAYILHLYLPFYFYLFSFFFSFHVPSRFSPPLFLIYPKNDHHSISLGGGDGYFITCRQLSFFKQIVGINRKKGTLCTANFRLYRMVMFRYSSPWRIEESLKSSSYLPGLVRSVPGETPLHAELLVVYQVALAPSFNYI